jgi:hypothetical protein
MSTQKHPKTILSTLISTLEVQTVHRLLRRGRHNPHLEVADLEHHREDPL